MWPHLIQQIFLTTAKHPCAHSHQVQTIQLLPAGVLYNNQMDDFSRPDMANTYKLQPSAANFIRPGKRPLSSMSPMMLTTPDGRLEAVVGASGGPRIISAVAATITRWAAAQLAICAV